MGILSESSGAKAYTTTSIEYKSKDGCTKSIREEEVENGFIVCIETYTPSKEGVESKWSTKKYISPTSLINKKQEKEEQNLSSVLKEFGYE